MNRSYKPANYPSVSVYIMAEKAQRVIDFVATVFGATPLRRSNRPDGSIKHAEMKIDDTVVMISDAMERAPAFPVWLHVYVPDVDATYRRALQAGATSVMEPAQEGDADRRGGVKDPAGNTWWIATGPG